MERNAKLLKHLDRILGIPLIFLLGLFRRKRLKPQNIKTYGIFAFAAIGDSILSSGLISSIRNQYPTAKIIIFASKANAAIYSVLSESDELVVLPVTKPWIAIPMLRQYPVDILIDTSQWSRLGALYASLARTKWSVGFKTAGQYRDRAYDDTIEHSSHCHEIKNFDNLLTILDIQSDSRLAFRGGLKNSQQLKIVSAPDKYIVIHPWASGSHHQLREWPESSWAELAKNLTRLNIDILISGSTADIPQAKKMAQQFDLGDRVRVIAGVTSFSELSNILLHSQGCVSVNTGIAHLSAGLGVPTIVLNGPTRSDRWGILGKNAINLDVSEADGGAFLNLGFEYPKDANYIMDKISVSSVLSALNNLKIV